jgi:hypothetical protein
MAQPERAAVTPARPAERAPARGSRRRTLAERARGFAFGAPRLGDALAVAALAALARGLVVLWAVGRFPPAEDGHYYQVVATRIARGLGYTWLWPDGAVTYAAHYPVGYPALLGAVYAVFGPRPGAAMAFNAALGVAATFAVHRLAATRAARGGALVAALAFALHPGLVFYTPAIMTEGVTASLLAVAAGIAVARRSVAAPRRRRFALLGIALGTATLVRPQCLLLAPAYAFYACRGTLRARLGPVVLVVATALAVCAPWTVRNCARMHACVLVSANAGWNLLIGAADRATGTWVPMEELGVPDECRTVWGEAEKDACFGRAARADILRHPARWLSLVPRKLAATFDYAGAAGFYLHSSNGAAFTASDKVVLGAVETVWERLVVLAALGAVASVPGARRRFRIGAALASGAFLFTRAGWVAHMGLCAVAMLLGRRIEDHPPAGLAAATVAGTALTHAVFFGAGRYGLVCFPFLAALAGTLLTRTKRPGDTEEVPAG